MILHNIQTKDHRITNYFPPTAKLSSYNCCMILDSLHMTQSSRLPSFGVTPICLTHLFDLLNLHRCLNPISTFISPSQRPITFNLGYLFSFFQDSVSQNLTLFMVRSTLVSDDLDSNLNQLLSTWTGYLTSRNLTFIFCKIASVAIPAGYLPCMYQICPTIGPHILGIQPGLHRERQSQGPHAWVHVPLCQL